ncbi:MAG: ubiquitin-conjugating enzyme E2 variant [Candidatus Kariarchaeaceae archaeon]|jgi:hypothetical protein
MVDDAVLSSEAAYIYQYAIGFTPVNGNLLLWRGIAEDSRGQSAQIQIKIPDTFPRNPPVVTLPGSTQHPRVDSNGEIRTRMIQQWMPSNHIYSVIREVKSVLRKGQFQTVEETSGQTSVLQSQISTLRGQLDMKRNELQLIQSQTNQEVASTQNLGDVIENSLLEVENEAYALEEAYDNLEIKAIDFAIQFVDARKRYYLIEQSRN